MPCLDSRPLRVGRRGGSGLGQRTLSRPVHKRTIRTSPGAWSAHDGVGVARFGMTLGVSQARVSKLEHQADARVSTLRAYVRALGGELETSAVFDDERIDLHLE